VITPARTAAAILELLDKKETPLVPLLQTCRHPDYESVWKEGPKVHRRFARLLIKKGHPMLALEVASVGIEKRKYTDDAELHYLRALALARCNNPSIAWSFVKQLLDWPALPKAIRSDSLSLAGRVHKDFAARVGPAMRQDCLRQAFHFYAQAFEVAGDYFPAINAATLAMLIDEPEQSKQLAAKVIELAEPLLDDHLQEIESATSNEERREKRDALCWLQATLGEARLLQGDLVAAKERYFQALQIAREEGLFGNIATMKRQLVLLEPALPRVAELLGLFHLGPVVVFAGPRLDRPETEMPRLPNDPHFCEVVKQAIRKELDNLGSSVGYCSPGSGCDILFGEAMRERNGELHLVLPFAEDDFLFECVDFGLAELSDWKKRYQDLKGFLRIEQHAATTEAFLNDQILHEFCCSFMQGLGLNRAEQFGVDAVALAVIDSEMTESNGLTAFVSNWRKLNRSLREIDLAKLRKKHPPQSISLPKIESRPSGEQPPRRLKAMLFGDVAGFSGVGDEALPKFFVAFCRIVVEELQKTPPLCKNTWGDGLYLVFEDTITAADFALRLLDRMEYFDFESHGFKTKPDKPPGVRLGLHYGPVFEIEKDPILESRNFYGSHVSRAARIEPVTVVGNAYCSEQFASDLALGQNHRFVCEYLGLQPLAKDFDDKCPLYRLTSKG
jgi:class 3 adenylate cyclase/tetratricopeptide (TPR) repeat protein